MHTRAHIHTCLDAAVQRCSSVSSCFRWRISEKVVVKGQADLLWAKVERKRAFNRLKPQKKREMNMI